MCVFQFMNWFSTFNCISDIPSFIIIVDWSDCSLSMLILSVLEMTKQNTHTHATKLICNIAYSVLNIPAKFLVLVCFIPHKIQLIILHTDDCVMRTIQFHVNRWINWSKQYIHVYLIDSSHLLANSQDVILYLMTLHSGTT